MQPHQRRDRGDHRSSLRPRLQRASLCWSAVWLSSPAVTPTLRYWSAGDVAAFPVDAAADNCAFEHAHDCGFDPNTVIDNRSPFGITQATVADGIR